jgi:c-di-GMP-binding flagellar brake protein YcgR
MSDNWQDRRKAQRTDISFPVECDVLPKNSYFYTVSKDLSKSGAKILTDRFIPKGNVIKIHLNIIDQVVEIKAKVAWCNKERVSPRYLTGVEFVEINRTDKGALSRLLNTIQ